MKKTAIMMLILCLAAQNVRAQVVISEAHKQRAASLVNQMTLDEKIDFIAGARSFYTHAVPRLGIPEIRMADGPQGIRNNTVSTLFPCGILTASTWNRDLARKLGHALGQDARARGVSILLGPVAITNTLVRILTWLVKPPCNTSWACRRKGSWPR